MAIKTYDPNQFTLTVFSPTIISHIVTGFAKDTFINMQWDEDLFNDEVDANGNVVRYKLNNYNTMLTVSLTQGSISNGVFSNFMNADRTIASGGVFTLQMKDNNGDTLITSAASWIKTPPDTSFGTNNANRDWGIRMTETAIYIGGINS
jgi:hypothetical protein